MRKLTIGELITDFISLIYPAYCLACSSALFKGEEIICSRCMLEMPQTNHHLDRDNPLLAKFTGRLRLVHASALFRFSKNGTIQHLLHQLKYSNHPEVGVVLGRLYGSKLKSSLPLSPDLIVPVPLHPSRMRRRGYNQSEKFAEGLSAELGVPFTDKILRRNVRTATQTRKSKVSRWANVDHIFSVVNPAAIKGQHVLLVDDVVTTGATIEACGDSLLTGGCASLSIACIAEA